MRRKQGGDSDADCDRCCKCGHAAILPHQSNTHQIQGGRGGNAVVNRCALILRYRESAVCWINEAYPNPSECPITLEQANEERTVYLISDSAGDNSRTLERWLRRHYARLFEMELNDWYTDPSLWPSERSYARFRQWFAPKLHTVVVDLGKGAIYDDEG